MGTAKLRVVGEGQDLVQEGAEEKDVVQLRGQVESFFAQIDIDAIVQAARDHVMSTEEERDWERWVQVLPCTD